MKKQTLKSLVLNKKTVSNLEVLSNLKGGDSFWPETLKFCPPPPVDPEPEPTPPSFFPVCSRYSDCPMI